MFSTLTGTPFIFDETHLTLVVGGVGYEVWCTERLLNRLKLTKIEKLTLFIETIVREDSIKLFGFESIMEKKIYIMLTTVQGVGPKAGLALLSALAADDLIAAISAKDVQTLTLAQGVGKKVAERIVAECSEKALNLRLSPEYNSAALDEMGLANHQQSDLAQLGALGGNEANINNIEAQQMVDEGANKSAAAKGKAVKPSANENKSKQDLTLIVMQALEGLGFSRAESFAVFEDVMRTEFEGMEPNEKQIIKACLKRLTPDK